MEGREVLWNKKTRYWSNNRWVKYLMQMEETCVLDVAEDKGSTLQKIADVLGVTRERVRQIVHNKGKEKGIVKRLGCSYEIRKMLGDNECETQISSGSKKA